MRSSLLFIRTLSIYMLSLWSFGCQPEQKLPKPTDGTVIRQGQEESEGNGDARAKWIELIHGGDQTDWRSIETQNQWDHLAYLAENSIQLRNGDEWVANNQILGKWIERGSSNNAGSIEIVDFDPVDEYIYAIGSGGCMFKGDLSGFGWTLINDKLRFSGGLLFVSTLNDGSKRLMAAINGRPHYSDNNGSTWTPSVGTSGTISGWVVKNGAKTKDGRIFYLNRFSDFGKIGVYMSTDNGKTVTKLKDFQSSPDNVSLAIDKAGDNIWIVEKKSALSLITYKYNKANGANGSIDEVANAASPITNDFRANLAAVTYRDTSRLYVYNKANEFYQSVNNGASWVRVSNFASDPWGVGVFVSPSDPRKVYYGEVNSYKSLNNGRNWTKMSDWGAYYGNPVRNLHADIMYMNEYKKTDGTNMQVNCNHGGIYVSTDYGLNWENIGQLGLNVSQYYDVRTHPKDPQYIFAGSQDQGQQKGQIRDEETAELLQNISGDYGHIEFTGNGKSLWSVYPGGSIGFYADPLSQNYPNLGYEIESINESVWIPPIIPGPDPKVNEVLAAGGSTDKSSAGSYLLRLKVVDDKIVASQYPHNFASGGAGQVSAIAISPQDTNRLYVATTNGRFFRSVDAGKTFVQKASALSGSHYLYGSCVLPSIRDKNTLYLSGNGYTNAPVYISTNEGETWTSMSSGLPKTTVFNIVANEDESLLFAASEAGPYVYIAAKNKWFPLGGQITPNQTYWSVEYVEATNTARFATYGRGVWDFDVKEVMITATEETDQSIAIQVYPNPSSDYISFKGLDPTKVYPVQVMNNQGRIVGSHFVGAGTGSIPVANLPKGQYFVVVKLDRLISKTIAFVVQ
jgi:hypothetical protein